MYLQFEHRGTDGHRPMTLEAGLDGAEYTLSYGHLKRVIVSCTLQSQSMYHCHIIRIVLKLNRQMEMVATRCPLVETCKQRFDNLNLWALEHELPRCTLGIIRLKFQLYCL